MAAIITMCPITAIFRAKLPAVTKSDHNYCQYIFDEKIFIPFRFGRMKEVPINIEKQSLDLTELDIALK